MQLLLLAISLLSVQLSYGLLDCTGKPDGHYSDPSGPCSQIYWQCTKGVASILFCPDGMAYFSHNDSCVNPNAMAACLSPVGGTDIVCAANSNGDFPNNASVCDQVSGHTCTNGQKSVRFCWATSRFDPLSQRCLFPKHMKACGGNDIILPSDLLPPQPTPTQLQFDCLKKIGNFPNPEQPCSNLFVICGPDGFPSAGVCPANTVFDADLNWCQYPQYVLACGGHPTNPSTLSSVPTTAIPTSALPTSVPSSTIPPPGATSSTMPPASSSVPPAMDTTLSCEGLDVGYYPNPKQPCSSTYYACTGLKYAIPEQCAPGTWFDRMLILCTYRDQIPECGGVRPNSTALPPAAAAPDTRFNCTGLKPGNFPDTDKQCSRFFYTCTIAGLAFKQLCPINTFYDKDLDQCLFYSDVPACSGTPRPTTMAPTTTQRMRRDLSSTAAAVDTFDCSLKQDRNYLPTGVKCSDYFWECAHGTAYKQSCPGDLKYDEYSDECLRETDVIGCLKYIPRSTFCASKTVDGAYPYPGQCDKYVMCIAGLESVLTCETGSVFDPRTNQCKKTTEVSAPCGTGPTPAALSCVGASQGIHWDKSDCAVYITCDANGAKVSRCQDGYAFDQATSTCLPMSKVSQCFPAGTDALNKLCQDIPDGIYAYPGNCRRSLICIAKKAYVFFCSDNANPWFDPVAHKCSPSNGACTASMSL